MPESIARLKKMARRKGESSRRGRNFFACRRIGLSFTRDGTRFERVDILSCRSSILLSLIRLPRRLPTSPPTTFGVGGLRAPYRKRSAFRSIAERGAVVHALGRDCAIRATRVGARGGHDNALASSRSVARHRRLRRPCRSLSDGAARRGAARRGLNRVRQIFVSLAQSSGGALSNVVDVASPRER